MMRLGAPSAVRMTCSLSNRPEAAPQAAAGCHHSPSSCESGRDGESAAFGSRKEVVPVPRDQQPFWSGERVLVPRPHALSVRMRRRPHGHHSTNFDKVCSNLPTTDSFFSSNSFTASLLAARGWADRFSACPPPCLDHSGAPAGSPDPGLRGPRRNRRAAASLAAAHACRPPPSWRAGGQTSPDVSLLPPTGIPGHGQTNGRGFSATLSRAAVTLPIGTRSAQAGAAAARTAATVGACSAHTSADAVHTTIILDYYGCAARRPLATGVPLYSSAAWRASPLRLLYSPFLQAKCSAKHLGQASTAPASPATCMQLPASCC